MALRYGLRGGEEARLKGNALPKPIAPLREILRTREPGSEELSLHRLHRNERLAPLPDWFVERIRSLVDSDLLTGYPVADELYSGLAAGVGLAPERLLLTAGSDAAFKALAHAYVVPGDPVVMLDPSYAMYAIYARMFGGVPQAVSFGDDLRLDLDALLARITPGVKLVLLANPNQPTGTLLSPEEVLLVAERASAARALLVVDEAYFPFSRTTVIDRVADVPNLVVVRTLSKASGLAGLRIGYLAAEQEVVATLFKVRSVHDVNSLAIACANELLAHPEVAEDYLRQVEDGARVLATRAEALGMRTLPTHTNFLLIRAADRCEPAELVASLRERGYLVRGPFTASCLAPYVRVTLGPPELMSTFADALADAVTIVTEGAAL